MKAPAERSGLSSVYSVYSVLHRFYIGFAFLLHRLFSAGLVFKY